MAAKGKRPTVEEELAALDAACRDPNTPPAREALRKALRTGSFLLAARAARLIERAGLDGMEDLQQALTRFFQDTFKRDPGCRAQSAIVDALDRLECMDPAPFLAAARRVQLEPGYRGATDTAVGVRARAIAALARIGYRDLLLAAGELLADPEAVVRQATLEALVHHGDRAGAGLALLKVRSGDPEPNVVLAAMNALLSLAADWGLAALRPILFGHDSDLRELAALAFGQCRGEEALNTLFELLERSVVEEERVLVVRALAFSRSERARQHLLETVAEGRPAEAEAAVLALGEQRYEAGLRDRVVEAAGRNPHAALEEAIARAFPGCT